MNLKLVAPLFFIGVFFGCNNTNETFIEQEPEIMAEANLFKIARSDNQERFSDYANYEISQEEFGIAVFSQLNGVVTLDINIFNQEPFSSHAIHLHHGTINMPQRHWNQGSLYAFCNQKSMGKAWAKPFAGDVGNVTTDASGNGFLRIQTDLWAINSGDNKDILDLVVILHQGPEDFIDECDPKHAHAPWDHSNPKIAGGTVTLISDVEKKAPSVISQFPEFTKCY